MRADFVVPDLVQESVIRSLSYIFESQVGKGWAMPDKVEVFASGLVNSNDDLFIELLAKGYDLMHFLGFIEQNLCFIQEYCQ